MQTLKTAAIVVLIMTVLYGAYVSLTTPPEPLPAEIENMLVETDELNIEAGFPSPSEMFAIDEGYSSDGMISAGVPADAGDFAFSGGTGSSFGLNPPSVATGPAPLTGPKPGSIAPKATSNSFDLVPSSFAGAPNSFGVTPNSFAVSPTPKPGSASTPAPKLSAAQANLGPSPLPMVASSLSGSTPKADPSRNYPTTPNQFSLPDPNSAASGFASNEGFSASIDDASQASVAKSNSTSASLSDQTAGVKPVGMSLPKSDTVKPASATTASAPMLKTNAPNVGLANAIQTADKQYKADQRKEALATLSLFYATPNLSPTDREQLLSRLDPLAGEVIYSRRHLLEQPHRVGHNETLMEIAGRYQVPWQLLANINGIQDPVTVLPGTELKVVRGPFRADVNLAGNELTLFLGDLYAGRFPVTVGNDPAPKPGTYTVQDKQTARTFYDASGSPIPANSPNNPYGTVWMDLGGQLSIHGSPERTRASTSGCVSLAGDLAEDLYGILSQGSSVTIRR